ncbi:YL1 nuclear protein-domain-containing protein [Tricharina praecox]|uniref:YL1 nuclear protein-domain-containing protein n=1 Tax=Tricharina praecox TaxID=43433 RepID=UPI002220A2B1|nr:YL1 nuclear protein-domain-containing protein [Tricharina praecox]KAI5848313.1 YL1 nuclear protein-domain-containing protein [Tricharina praecox]
MSIASSLDDDDDTLSSVPPSSPHSPASHASHPPSQSPTTATPHISPAALPVQSLVAGRERRSNAGNLLAKLLTQEADADDTLFLEDEDDVEFSVKKEDRGDDDDVLMDSSSDSDEDAAEGGEEGEAEGEREIVLAEKEARKARKRKADDAFMKPRKQPAPRKERRVTIREGVARVRLQDEELEEAAAEDADELGDALSRPRKKSERISWVPEFVATRASSRTLSLQNRSETMRRLEESEKRRLHTIALMERAAAKKEKVRPKREMTQEERLEEAKITERRNRRSLFSWEETEKAKLEEQRERLAALQNRKLAGPVITYWSGAAEWNAETGRLVKVGRGLVQEVVEVEAPVKKKRLTKKEKEEKEKEKEKAKVQAGDEKVATRTDATASSESATRIDATTSSEIATRTDATAPSESATIVVKGPSSPMTSAPPIIRAPDPAASTVTATSTTTISPRKAASNFPVFVDGVAEVVVKEDPALPEAVPSVPSIPPLETTTPLEKTTSLETITPLETAPSVPDGKTHQSSPPPPPQGIPGTPPPPPPPNQVSARNLIVLENFEPSTVRDKASLVKLLWGEQTRRLGAFSSSLLFFSHP